MTVTITTKNILTIADTSTVTITSTSTITNDYYSDCYYY